MNGLAWSIAALVFVLASWLWCNVYYGRIHGQRLRWRYFWAAHAALFWAYRLPKWEKRR